MCVISYVLDVLTLEHTMSPLQKEVWGFLLRIGAGEVLAYSTVRVLVEYLTALFSFLPWRFLT